MLCVFTNVLYTLSVYIYIIIIECAHFSYLSKFCLAHFDIIYFVNIMYVCRFVMKTLLITYPTTLSRI